MTYPTMYVAEALAAHDGHTWSTLTQSEKKAYLDKAEAAVGAIVASEEGWRIVLFGPVYANRTVPMVDLDGEQVLAQEWT